MPQGALVMFCRQCHFFRKLRANHSRGSCSVKFHAGQPCIVEGNGPACLEWFLPRQAWMWGEA